MSKRTPRSLLAERTQRAVARRRVFPLLSFVTLSLGIVAGIVMTWIDGKDFPTYGDGVWWAIVTLGTVGYGDLVPTTTPGRVLGSIVIIFGVTFIAFLTATVTSAFVSAVQAEAREEELTREVAAEEEVRRLLHEITERLTALETKLNAR